jgi:hypothetical protein
VGDRAWVCKETLEREREREREREKERERETNGVGKSYFY